MVMEIRGGIPRTRRYSVTTTGDKFPIVNAPTKYLQIGNEGANAVRIYWTEADFDANANYLELGATGSGANYFEGPVELSEPDAIWMRSLVGTSNAVVVVSYQRRG